MYIFALNEVVMSLRGAYLFHAVNVPVAEAIVIFHFKVAPHPCLWQLHRKILHFWGFRSWLNELNNCAELCRAAVQVGSSCLNAAVPGKRFK